MSPYLDIVSIKGGSNSEMSLSCRMESPNDLTDDFFKLSLTDIPRLPVYPSNATEEDKRQLDENCQLAGEVCSRLTDSLKYGFSQALISKHLFIALHIYGGRDTIVAYYPSRLFREHIIIQNGEKSNRFFLLDCRTGLLGTLDRRVDSDDRIIFEDRRLLLKNVHDIPPDEPRAEVIPVLILVKKQLSDQYIVRKGTPNSKQTFVVIITQSDYPERTVIKV